ncbi:hypothetical protein KJ359_002411 [Pestalotiopsis sp. 9143b]|nr:hypothetical protein KJ359_002411 [Pestalotiopsis sp. 9143b]
MTFRYEPLSDVHSFRLLRLLGGEGGDVECELFQTTTVYNRLPYEAVSYCWGPAEVRSAIIIDGRPLVVRQSLITLLKDLRHSNTQKHRLLWIDAICIDQQNKVEQGHQVQQMRDLYALARHVIFWVGETTPDATFLMKALHKFNRTVKPAGWHQSDTIRDTWEEVLRDLKKDPFILDAPGRLHEAFREFLRRPWFRRAWIIQEVANARRGSVQCGKRFVTCRTFVHAHALLGGKTTQQSRNILDAMPTHWRTSSWWSEERDLFSVLQKFRDSESTLSSDKIYALRGLCSFREDASFFSVDYQQPVQHVILDAIAHMCLCDRDSLPDTLYSNMEAFLRDLESMHSRVFLIMVKSEQVDSVRNMLKHHSALIKFPSRMLDYAVSSTLHGRALTEILLEFCGENFVMTDSIMNAACKNEAHGSSIVNLLLSHLQPGTMRFSRHVVVSAARNRAQGARIIDALVRFHPHREEIVAPEVVYSILTNEDARDEIRDVLFRQIPVNIKASENLAVAAATNGDDLMKLKAFFESNEVAVTEEILLATSRNITMGPAMLKYLLQSKPARHFRITSRLVVAAIDASIYHLKLLDVLLSYRHEEISMADDILMAILKNNHRLGILDLFESKQGSIRISQTATSIRPDDQSLDWTLLKGPSGHSVVWWALGHAQGPLLEALIKNGADITADGRILCSACELGNASIARILVENGADVGSTPFTPAKASRALDRVLRFLLKRGIPANEVLLRRAASVGNVAVVDFALRNRPGMKLDEALAHAARHNQTSVVQLLLDAGAPTEIQDTAALGPQRR